MEGALPALLQHSPTQACKRSPGWLLRPEHANKVPQDLTGEPLVWQSRERD